MNILITGGAGFIGSSIAQQLYKSGHRVVSIDDYSSGLTKNHIPGVKYINCDIESISEIKNEYDIIFHLAALSRIQPSFKNPSETFRVNTLGTQLVCDFARLNNSKVIYSGSSSKWHNPYQSPYAACKHMGEEICKMYKKTYNLNIQIARFYNVFGPREIIYGDWAAVIGKWRGLIKIGAKIPIVGDGEQRRDFTYIDDIVDGLCKIAFSNENHTDAWELGSGHNYSINEVFSMFQKKFNCEPIYVVNEKGNYRSTLRKNDDMLEKLNWKPSNKLEEYIKNL